MNKKYFDDLAGFNNWADQKVISWLKQISDEQWNQVCVSSFSSVKQTAIHIASAEKIWIDFWTGAENPVYLSAIFKGTRDELITIWETASAALKHFIQEGSELDLTQPVKFTYPDGRIALLQYWQTFAHVVNHSTYHRGQLVTLLRHAGYDKFSSMDLATYYLAPTV